MNGYKTDHIEYVDIDRWRTAIRNSRLHDEAEVQKLKGRIESMSLELELLERKLDNYRVEEELMSRTILAYEERMEQPSKRSTFQGNNLRETLIIHFVNSSGVIIGKQASKALVELGYFSDRNSADGAVYTALGKSPFQKFDKGIYIIPTDSPEWKRLRGTNGKILDARALAQLGLKEQPKLCVKVSSMLAEHPKWNIKHVTKELQRQRWDFEGKNPISAVSAAFMRRRKDQKRAVSQTLQLLLSNTS